MTCEIGHLVVRNRRDLPAARSRIRQLAGLLGFDSLEQSTLAAAVFSWGWQALDRPSTVEIACFLHGPALNIHLKAKRNSLQDSAKSSEILNLEKALPPGGIRLAPEEVQFAFQQIGYLTRNKVLFEVHSLNQELLAALTALAQLQKQLISALEDKSNSSAA